MTRPDIAGIAPFFIVRNVPAALSFYRDRLGVRGHVARARAWRHLLRHRQAGSRDDHPRGHWCRANAELHAGRQEGLPAGTLTSTSPIRTRWPRNSRRATSSSFDHSGGDVPKDDDDGLRGFEVQDADGYVLLFGRPRSW